MILKNISFKTPEENILYDEVLFRLAEKGQIGETLRLWESSRIFVVLGLTGKIEEEINAQAVRKDNIPVLRRCSGGGTVLQGRGCLNFSFVVSKERNPLLKDLHKSYKIILDDVISILGKCGKAVGFYPISDLALVESKKKVSGNAQKRGRKFILHHGTLLYDFDISLIEKYLAYPSRIPEYRENRSHNDFVANLKLDSKIMVDSFKQLFSCVEEGVSREENKFLSELLEKNKMREIS